MEVGIKELRDHLSRYLEVVRDGQEVTLAQTAASGGGTIGKRRLSAG